MLWFAAACICMWLIAISMAGGESIPTRFPLSSAQVINAMESRQLPISGVQVRLAAPITAAVIDPKLEIRAVSLLSSHQIRLRVSCRDQFECLSFFAIATYVGDLDQSALKLAADNPTFKPHQPRAVCKDIFRQSRNFCNGEDFRAGREANTAQRINGHVEV